MWIDKKNKSVVVQGETCSADCPLEFLRRVLRQVIRVGANSECEAVDRACGPVASRAEPGHPAQFQPKFSPTGTEIAIEVRWKDAKGKLQACPAQQWVRDIKTKKALDANWVFAGSIMVTDETTGKQSYIADRGGGYMICVLSTPAAMLDLPMFGSGAIEDRTYEKFKEHIPPEGTSVTLLLKPILSTNPSAKGVPAAKPPADAGNRNKHAAAEQQAVDAAEPWLALVDRGEYSQAWESAASFLKDQAGRREFIQVVGDKRKPLGKLDLQTTRLQQYATSLPGARTGSMSSCNTKSPSPTRSGPSKPSLCRCRQRQKVASVGISDRIEQDPHSVILSRGRYHRRLDRHRSGVRALELDRRGFRVFAGIRTTAAAEQLRGGLCPLDAVADRRDPDRYDCGGRKVVAETLSDAGLAGLVNNAGIAVPGPLELIPIDDFRRQLEVNAGRPTRCYPGVSPLLRKGPRADRQHEFD